MTIMHIYFKEPNIIKSKLYQNIILYNLIQIIN